MLDGFIISNNLSLLQCQHGKFSLDKVRGKTSICGDADAFQSLTHHGFIDIVHSEDLAKCLLQFHLRNRRRMLADTLAMLDFVGASPHGFTVVLGNTPVDAATFRTNKKTTQYVFRVVLGGLSLIGGLSMLLRLPFSACTA